MKIGRNDPCPCGSGKKYKKCCGGSSVISIQHIVNQEIIQLQNEIIEFAINQYSDEIYSFVEENLEEIMIPDDIEDFYLLMGYNLTIFTLPVEGEKTPFELFIEQNLRHIKRPKLKEILPSWVGVTPSVTEIKTVDGPNLVVEDVLTKETKNVIILDKENIGEEIQLKEGTLLFGFLVPIGESYTFFTTYIDFKNQENKISQLIIDEYEINEDLSPQEFMEYSFLLLLDRAFYTVFSLSILEDMSWDDPKYEEVAELYKSQIEREDYNDTLLMTGLVIWSKYCEKKRPQIKNVGLYAAAIHYVVSRNVPYYRKITLKELQETYGANSNSISERARQIEWEMQDFLTRLNIASHLDKLEDTFEEEKPLQRNRYLMERTLRETERRLENVDMNSIDDLNQYINDDSIPSRPLTDEEQAQELVYDAYESSGKKRKALIEKALKLDQNNADAYIVLAEEAETFEEALELYREGMIRGEKSLGKEFYEENKGHFWGIVKTRPFMRAKYHYAEMLYETGDLVECTNHFEELLELNPNDNLGVRFLLFNIYVEKNEFKKAKELLQRFSEDYSVHSVYNLLLLELLENSSSMKAQQLLKEAQKRNSHVVPLLLEGPFIDEPVPYFSPGDENEALAYLYDSGYLWLDKPIERLQELLQEV